MIVQRFNLNLIPNQSPVIVHVNQYDTGTGRLIATLYEGNEPYSPSGTAVIQGTKPDGHGFQYSATLNGNVVTADLTEQMSPVAGDVRAQIVVTESSGVTGTFVFIMRVQPSALPNDTDMSESDYPLIEEAIREAQEAVIDSHNNAENSEAWAQGTRGGIPVGPTDPTYEHNAEYWAHQAEGAASGVRSFNGRSGSVLPVAGDYDSEKILLASALHIGGETQNNVQEALEALVNDGGAGHTILNGLGQEMPQRKNLRFAGANLSDDAENDTTNVTITGGSGGSTITVTTIETTLYGETVTITDGTSTFTGVFDNSGVCVIDGVTATGTLTVTSGAASRTLNVPYFGNYTVALSFWAATINVSTDPDVVSAIVKKDGVQIDTISFSAGSGVYVAESTGAYTFTATVGGIDFTSPTVNVTEQTTYSTVIDIFNATLSISTSSSELYGKTITIKKGSTVVGTTAFSAQGSATYTVHETGTYTCECEGYSGSATVSAETTYNVTINAGLDLSSWISAGSTTDYPLNPSSYADFSALEADEAAVRQLMTVHASVDYLAQATAGDSLMEDIVNSDVCAKWINLSDYAYDVLSVSWTGKNLLKNTATTQTINGVTFTVNADKSVTVNGTATNDIDFIISPYKKLDIENGYVFSGISNGSYGTYCLRIGYRTIDNAWIRDQDLYDGSTSVSIPTAAALYQIKATIVSGTTVSNLTFYPMIRKADITDPTYEPYFNAMDAADKYGYGEWGIVDATTTPPTWGALGNVPIMTANNAPYGTAISDANYAETYQPYFVFMTNPQYGWLGPTTNEGTHYIGYKFVNPVCVRKVKIGTKLIGYSGNAVDSTVKLRYSNDGSTWTELDDSISIPAYTDTVANVENDVYALYWAIRFVSWNRTNPYNMNVCSSLQFYGRELKPLVPTMTGANTPKGEVVASTYDNRFSAPYYVFSGSVATADTQGWYSGDHGDPASIGYKATEPMHAKMLMVRNRVTSTANQVFGAYQFTLEGYNGSTWETIQTYEDNNNTSGAYRYFNISTYSDEYTGLRLNCTAGASGQSQTDATWISMLQFYGPDYSEKEFAQGSTRKTIYDHGVEPSGTITGGTKNPDCLTLSAVGTATVTIDKGTRTYMGGKVGLHASGTNRLICGSGYSAFTASNMPDSNGFDISSISGSVAVGIEQTTSGTFDAVEIWIE